MVIKAITKSNALAFFGADIGEWDCARAMPHLQQLIPNAAQNEEFLNVGSAFIEQTLIIAEVCRLLPDAISE